MIKIFRTALPILLLVSPLFAWAAEQTPPPSVEALLYDSEPGAEYVRIRLTGRVEPVVFQLPGENPRVVCDLPAVAYPSTMKRTLPVGGEIIRRIRVGVHHEPEPKTRIVVDLMHKGDYTVAHEYIDAGTTLSLRIALKTTEMKATLVPTDTTGSTEDFTPLQTAPASSEVSSPVKEDDADSGKEAVSGPAAPTKMPPAEAMENTAEDDPPTKTPSGEEQSEEALSPEPAAADAGNQPETQQQKSTLELGGGSGVEDRVGEDELPVLLDITYESSTNDKEMVLFRLSGFYPPVVFSSEGEDLLVVCDFLDAMLGYDIDNLLQTDGKYIQSVRIEKISDPDKVRAVLDLAEGYNYDVKQVFFKEDNLFVVVISSLGKKK